MKKHTCKDLSKYYHTRLSKILKNRGEFDIADEDLSRRGKIIRGMIRLIENKSWAQGDVPWHNIKEMTNIMGFWVGWCLRESKLAYAECKGGNYLPVVISK